jgi:uncharacterized membrane protein
MQSKTSHLLFMAQKEHFDETLRTNARISLLYKQHSRDTKELFLLFAEGLIGTSITLDIFWAIIFITTLNFATMMSLISIIGVAALALGIGVVWKNYKQKSKTQNNLNTKLENVICKRLIYEEIFKRKQQKLVQHTRDLLQKINALPQQNADLLTEFKNTGIDIHALLANEKLLVQFVNDYQLQTKLFRIKNKCPILNDQVEPVLKNINRKSKILKACIAGISLITIFGSFFAFGSYIFVGLGLASVAAVFSNPITIALVLALATILGAFYAYQYYQQSVAQSRQKNVIAHQETIVKNLQCTCDSIDTRIKQLKKLEDTATFEMASIPFFLRSKPRNKMGYDRSGSITLNPFYSV